MGRVHTRASHRRELAAGLREVKATLSLGLPSHPFDAAKYTRKLLESNFNWEFLGLYSGLYATVPPPRASTGKAATTSKPERTSISGSSSGKASSKSETAVLRNRNHTTLPSSLSSEDPLLMTPFVFEPPTYHNDSLLIDSINSLIRTFKKIRLLPMPDHWVQQGVKLSERGKSRAQLDHEVFLLHRDYSMTHGLVPIASWISSAEFASLDPLGSLTAMHELLEASSDHALHSSIRDMLSMATMFPDTLELPKHMMIQSLLTNIFPRDLFMASWKNPPPARPYLAQTSAPLFEFFVRPRPDALEWSEELLPTLFAAVSSHSSPQVDLPSQLARAFHATLNMLIVCHLSSRQSPDDPLPKWMYLYGIIYNENGLTLYIHFPRYDHEKGRWKYISKEVYSEHAGCLDPDEPQGLWAIDFVRMATHSLFVAHRLAEWEHWTALRSFLLST